MSRKHFSVGSALGALLLARAVAPQAAQEPPAPTFPSQVEQVTVDVVVVEKKGVPVRGLAREDFEVLEDGVPQSLVSFEAVEVPPAPAALPKARPRVSTNQEGEGHQGRTFVVLFDDIRLTPAMAYEAKGAVADFLAHAVREGDWVTLVATQAGTWWTSRMEAGRDELIALVKRLDGNYIPDDTRERLTDLEAKRIHRDQDRETANRVQRRYVDLGVIPQQTTETSQNRFFATSIDPYVQARAAAVYSKFSVRTRTTLAILERSLEALNATRGRKSVILLSAGFIWDSDLEEFRRVERAARRANAAVYFVNAEGLKLPAHMSAQFGAPVPQVDLGYALTEDFWDAEGAEVIASETGGFSVRDTNDLSAGLKRIADENSTYYLLGYNSTNPARDGAYRKIAVRMVRGARKDLEIRARKGYYAPGGKVDTRRPKPAVDPVFQEALDSPHQMGNLPLRMTHFVGEEGLIGKVKVEVVTEVDLRAMTLEARDGRFVGGIEFLLMTAQRETGEIFRYDQKLDLKLLPASRDRYLKTWFPIRREFLLPPGGYQAKIVVRDARSGRVATVLHEFDVPEPATFRISTPVIGDAREEGGDLGGRVARMAHREFEQGQTLFCEVEVYGAQKEGSGMPQVGMGYAVTGADGRVLTRVDPTPILPTSLGTLTRVMRFSLETAPPGEYTLVMAFFDMLAGKMLELREPFSVRPKEPAPAHAER